MPKFTYISCNEDGKQTTAVVEAESRQELLLQLKERGLTVLRVEEGSEGAFSEKKKSSFAVFKANFLRQLTRGRVKTGDFAAFWRQFATMVAAGLSVIQALESIAEELEKGELKFVLDRVIADMWEGLSLSQALARHKHVFSTMIVALMAAAEESGSLPSVAEEVARFLENRDRIIRKVWAALTYPIFLCGFFLVVVIVATFWIIPLFRDIYTGFKAKLPLMTEIVFAINATCLRFMPLIVAAVITGTTVLILWAKKPTGRAVIDRLMLRMPVFGTLLRRAAIARFARSFAVLNKGGISISRTFEMIGDTAGNAVIADAIRASREAILRGGKIAASLRQHPIFPRMAIRMIAAGEETGSLGDLLERTADFYEARVDAAVSTINALIEPIIIIMIGCFVLVFVLALYLPIFSLAASMKG